MRRLTGTALLSGFYLNELLIRTLAREDPHEQLFDDYRRTIETLAEGRSIAPALRRFEKALLAELGYAMPLDHDVRSGAPIDAAAHYTYDPERGPVRLASGESAAVVVGGQALLDLAGDVYTDPVTLAEVKNLMRFLISHRIDAKPILSRQLLRDLREL